MTTERENEPPSRIRRALTALGIAGGVVVIVAVAGTLIFGWDAMQRGADYRHPGSTQPVEPAVTVSSPACR